MTLSELIERLGGKLVQGDPEWMVDGVNLSERANPFDVVFADSSATVLKALSSKAGVVVLLPAIAGSYPRGKCIVEYDNPRLWFARAAKLLVPATPSTGVHPKAVVMPDAILGIGATVEACAVVESGARIGAHTRVEAGAIIGHGVQVGEKCRIHPRAVLYPGTKIGDRVIVHAGAVLGADGFGYVRDAATGAYTQFPQQGTLVVEDDVEIGANSTIDRGALAETRIRRGTKIDNLVHVGHNCDIGEDVILVALTGISGSSSVGKGAIIGGAGGYWGSCQDWTRGDSWRPGRRVEWKDGHQQRSEARHGAVGHAGAAAEAGLARTGDVDAARSAGLAQVVWDRDGNRGRLSEPESESYDADCRGRRERA